MNNCPTCGAEAEGPVCQSCGDSVVKPMTAEQLREKQDADFLGVTAAREKQVKAPERAFDIFRGN
jgi:NADPH-dependent glutamate synthase beta subunit-like oxidoreductase